MRRMNIGEEKSIDGDTEAMDGKSNELGFGRTMLSSQCDSQVPVESLNEGIRGNFDGEVGLSGGAVSPVTCDGQGNRGILVQVENSGSGNFREQDLVVQETVVAVDHEGNASGDGYDGGAEVQGSECQQSSVILGKLKIKILQEENSSHVIDVKCGGGIEGSQKDLCDCEGVCRICHLSSEGSLEDGTSPTADMVPTGLIHLGCGCKDELGIAHNHCAETWFKLRGNRTCEICGETAENVSSIVDNRLTQSERRFIMGIASRSSEQSGGCWQEQPFCNFLMACLVIAFVLPWFFRINLF